MRRFVAVLVVLAGCGGGASPSTVHRADGVAYRVPAGWHVAKRSLTPHLVNPRELFTAGTGRLPLVPARCAQVPAAALAAMRADDVLVSVEERLGNDAGFAPRPRRFVLGPSNTDVLRPCAGPGSAIETHWSGFRDGGRGFHVLVAVGPSASRARVREALAILDSMRIRPAPFVARLHAARFPGVAGWHVRVSGPQHESRCLRQHISWASTVPFTDGARELPPHTMIEALPPDGIIVAVAQWTECKSLRAMRALAPPLRLGRAVRMQFPGPRGDELPLYRLIGRFPGRYYVDAWIFFGRHRPTAAQRARAQRELAGVRWPAAL